MNQQDRQPEDVHAKRGGFTLVEVNVAILIFAIAMLSIGWTVIMAQQMGKVARNRISAMHYASTELERLLRFNYDDDELDLVEFEPIAPESGDYSGRYSVKNWGTGEMKLITVEIRYQSYGGEFRWLILEGVRGNVFQT